VKNFLSCFVQHRTLHYTAKYWMKIFRDERATISWSSNSKTQNFLVQSSWKTSKFQMVIISEIQVQLKKFQRCWAQKLRPSPLWNFVNLNFYLRESILKSLEFGQNVYKILKKCGNSDMKKIMKFLSRIVSSVQICKQ